MLHVDKDGFYFRENSERKDLDTAEYGLTRILPYYVLSQIFGDQNSSLIYFREGYWWKHQDLYVARRSEVPYTSNGSRITLQRKIGDAVNGKILNLIRRIRNRF